MQLLKESELHVWLASYYIIFLLDTAALQRKSEFGGWCWDWRTSVHMPSRVSEEKSEEHERKNLGTSISMSNTRDIGVCYVASHKYQKMTNWEKILFFSIDSLWSTEGLPPDRASGGQRKLSGSRTSGIPEAPVRGSLTGLQGKRQAAWEGTQRAS